MKPDTGRLDSYGLVSRGNDVRLQQDPVAQREYFDLILREYLSFCATSRSVGDLRDTFEGLGYRGTGPGQRRASAAAGRTSTQPAAASRSVSLGAGRGAADRGAAGARGAAPTAADPAGRETLVRRRQLDDIVMALRTLREAVLASPPCALAKSVLLLSIRVTVLLGHYESYLPSMLQLLDTVHPVLPLSDAELHEVVALYALHLVHFANNAAEAYAVMDKYNVRDDLPLRQIIAAMVDCDYVLWRRRYVGETDPGRRRMMAFGERNMTRQTLKRLGMAYFHMPVRDVERLTGWSWDDCVNVLGCGWRLEGDRVVMRERKTRPPAGGGAGGATAAAAAPAASGAANGPPADAAAGAALPATAPAVVPPAAPKPAVRAVSAPAAPPARAVSAPAAAHAARP
ncbi:uncharacterized protein V1510DRAFT_406032 [Dipodascopsis tothii]|uniref:uncharacterized protein n=1 Tax=Dipodascopsis tothii TaxID=44089 RepID=UPI0034CE1F60